MKKHFIALLMLLIAVALASCAPRTRTVKIDDERVEEEAKIQREISFKSTQNKNLKLQDIAYPLLVSAVPFCGEKAKPALGMMYANKFSFKEEYQDIAAQYYGMDDNLKVIDIYPTSPAEEAGLSVGDIVKEINNDPVATGENATEKITAQIDKHLVPKMPMKINVIKDGRETVFDLIPELACNYTVVLVNSDDINAFADGQRVAITQGMMRFVENEQELSLVIAHELAHNSMGHIRSKMGNALIGTLLDIAVGTVTGISTQGIFSQLANQVYSQEFEAEADYVGLYIMANAGQEVEGAANFWRRLAAANPGGIKKGAMSSHPSTPERFLAIEESTREIKDKIQEGKPLRPEMK